MVPVGLNPPAMVALSLSTVPTGPLEGFGVVTIVGVGRFTVTMLEPKPAPFSAVTKSCNAMTLACGDVCKPPLGDESCTGAALTLTVKLT